MDSLIAMRGFLKVVEAGNFTRAALLMGMPKSTLTKVIQTLETELKVKLLNRTTRRVAVTAEGATYYDRLVRLLDEFDDLNASVIASQAIPSGRLLVEMSATSAREIVLPMLGGFQEAYPDIRLEIKISDGQADLIGDGIDCVIRAGNLVDPSLIARHLAEMKIVTCAAPQYFQMRGVPLCPQDLEDHHVAVSYMNAETGQFFPFDFEKNGEKRDVRCSQRLAIDEGGSYVSAAVAGLGLIQVPWFMVRDHVAAGRLETVLDDWTSRSRPYFLVYPPNKHVSARLRAFIEWVARVFAKADL